ncbi:hypothetical protein JCM6882_003856 [Rhodosporidiobolus microsporus]
MDGPTETLSSSIAGFRPRPSLPHFPGFSFPRPSVATSTTATSHSTLSPAAHRSDGPNTLLVTIIPIVVGALLLLAGLYALLQWQHRRTKRREEETQMQAVKLRRVRYGGGTTAGSFSSAATSRGENVELELHHQQSVEDMLNTLKFREDLARVERSSSFKTHDLPRKPPPAYEPFVSFGCQASVAFVFILLAGLLSCREYGGRSKRKKQEKITPLFDKFAEHQDAWRLSKLKRATRSSQTFG